MTTCMVLSAVSWALSRLRAPTPRLSSSAFLGSRKRIEFARKKTPTTLQVRPMTPSSDVAMDSYARRTDRPRTAHGYRIGCTRSR